VNESRSFIPLKGFVDSLRHLTRALRLPHEAVAAPPSYSRHAFVSEANEARNYPLKGSVDSYISFMFRPGAGRAGGPLIRLACPRVIVSVPTGTRGETRSAYTLTVRHTVSTLPATVLAEGGNCPFLPTSFGIKEVGPGVQGVETTPPGQGPFSQFTPPCKVDGRARRRYQNVDMPLNSMKR